MALRKYSAVQHAGFSLIELLIAMAVGLLILTGLSLIFVNASSANKELQKTAQQIENGRYAIDILSQNIHHAGYYGHLYSLPTTPGTLSDPCDIVTTQAKLDAALPFPVQGYRAADTATRANVTATTCVAKGFLTNANLKPGSDVLVIRRLSTQVLTGNSVTNEVYVQASNLASILIIGDGNPPATLAGATLTKKDGTKAPIRKYMTHVYFVAPCSVGKGANGVCNGSAQEDTIPTLKRLELTVVAGSTDFQIVPLAEGVEYLKLEYGVDNLPSATNPTTGLVGDATVDVYTPAAATPGTYAPALAAAADWTNAITVKAYVLARNTEMTPDYTDTKSYTLGTTAVPAANDRYKRHVFAAAIRVANAVGRKEIP